MNISKTASVKMQWDTFTFPIQVGTPISDNGVLSNDEDAFGLVIRTVDKKPDADEFLQVMTGGIIDMEEVIAGYGTELTTAAMTAMSGIHVYSEGKRVNLVEEKVDKANVANNLTTTEEGKVLDARQGKALNNSLDLKLDASKVEFHGTVTDDSPKAEFDVTSAGTFVIRYYTNYISDNNNYGRQIVMAPTFLRLDSISNGEATTLWTK